MARRATVDPVGEDEEIEFHPEGVALFSPNDSCFGMSLSDIVDEVRPNISEYGDAVVMEPHEASLPLGTGYDVDEQRILYENSVWLVDCDCILDDEFFLNFKYLIRTFPRPGNVIIWIDDNVHEADKDDKTDIKNFATKPDVVCEKQRLLQKVEAYIEYSANPVNSTGNIAEWRNRVHQIQRTLG